MNTIRNTPSTSRKGSRALASLALALVAALFLGTACNSEEGETPTCVQDVTADGHTPTEKGCNPFAPCVVNGTVQPATECCKSVGGGNPDSYDYQACMYGYGAGPEPGTK